MMLVTMPMARSVQPPEEAGGDAGRGPDRRGDGDGERRDPQRGEDRHHHPREDVAAELVGTHPVRGRRWREAVGGILLQRRIRRQAEGREDRDDHQHGDDDEADDACGRRPQPAQPAAAGRAPAPTRRPASRWSARSRSRQLHPWVDAGVHRSTTTLTTTNSAAMTSTLLCTTAYSRWEMPVRISRPIPGRAKISSTITVPPRR